MVKKVLSVGAALIVVAMIIVQIPFGNSAANPRLPQPDKEGKANHDAVAGYVTLLNEEVDVTIFHQQAKLSDVLKFLSSKANTGGKELPIHIDQQSFVKENPDAPAVIETSVQLPKTISRMTRAMLLRYALQRVPTDNGTYLVRRDGIRITTLTMSYVPQLLREKVVAVYKKKPLDEVLVELSQIVGVSVVIDPRTKDKIKTPITTTFTNATSMNAAFGLLTDVAGLKCVVSSTCLYVTTPERLEELRKTEEKQLDSRMKRWKASGLLPAKDDFKGTQIGGFAQPGAFGIGPGGFAGQPVSPAQRIFRKYGQFGATFHSVLPHQIGPRSGPSTWRGRRNDDNPLGI